MQLVHDIKKETTNWAWPFINFTKRVWTICTYKYSCTQLFAMWRHMTHDYRENVACYVYLPHMKHFIYIFFVFFSLYLLNVWLWFFQQKFYPLILFYGTLNNFSLFSLFSVYYFRAESSGTTLNKWHGAFELVAKNILHKLFAFSTIVVVGRQKRRTKYIFTTTIAETAKRRKKLCFQLIQWSIYCVPLSLSDKY